MKGVVGLRSSVVGWNLVVARASFVLGKWTSLAWKVGLSCTLLALTTCLGQATSDLTSDREQHIRELEKQLPADSLLKKALITGARGDGVRRGWMDEMRAEGIESVIVWVETRFNSAGKPIRMKVAHIRYYSGYDESELISDPRRLDVIRNSGLEKQLTDLALQQAAHGAWVDIPRPRPHPFVGGTRLQFLDDEWLPNQGALYCSGRPCLGE